jgi:hypothetical protein
LQSLLVLLPLQAAEEKERIREERNDFECRIVELEHRVSHLESENSHLRSALSTAEEKLDQGVPLPGKSSSRESELSNEINRLRGELASKTTELSKSQDSVRYLANVFTALLPKIEALFVPYGTMFDRYRAQDEIANDLIRLVKALELGPTPQSGVPAIDALLQGTFDGFRLWKEKIPATLLVPVQKFDLGRAALKDMLEWHGREVAKAADEFARVVADEMRSIAELMNRELGPPSIDTTFIEKQLLPAFSDSANAFNVIMDSVTVPPEQSVPAFEKHIDEMRSALDRGQTVLFDMCRLLQTYPEVQRSTSDHVTQFFSACADFDSKLNFVCRQLLRDLKDKLCWMPPLAIAQFQSILRPADFRPFAVSLTFPNRSLSSDSFDQLKELGRRQGQLRQQFEWFGSNLSVLLPRIAELFDPYSEMFDGHRTKDDIERALLALFNNCQIGKPPITGLQAIDGLAAGTVNCLQLWRANDLRRILPIAVAKWYERLDAINRLLLAQEQEAARL